MEENERAEKTERQRRVGRNKWKIKAKFKEDSLELRRARAWLKDTENEGGDEEGRESMCGDMYPAFSSPSLFCHCLQSNLSKITMTDRWRE